MWIKYVMWCNDGRGTRIFFRQPHPTKPSPVIELVSDSMFFVYIDFMEGDPAVIVCQLWDFDGVTSHRLKE